MKKRGFTLIELLAVMVILAIVALIATPIILSIIKDAKVSSNKRSVESVQKSLQNSIIGDIILNNSIISGVYKLRGDKLYLNDVEVENFKVEYSGASVDCDYVLILDDVVYVDECSIGGQTIDYSYGNLTTEGELNVYYNIIKKVIKENNFPDGKYETHSPRDGFIVGLDDVSSYYTLFDYHTKIESEIKECTVVINNGKVLLYGCEVDGVKINTAIGELVNGQEIYYNPIKNEICYSDPSEANYLLDNHYKGQITDNTNGCMKWYAFLNENSENINLFLNHSTHENILSDKSEVDKAINDLIQNYNWSNSVSIRMLNTTDLSEILNQEVDDFYSSSYSSVPEWLIPDAYKGSYLLSGNEVNLSYFSIIKIDEISIRTDRVGSGNLVPVVTMPKSKIIGSFN